MLSVVAEKLVVDAPLTMQEYLMREPVPLASVFRVVFDCLRSRPGTVVYGSQALNAYVAPPRMTEDVDVFALDAPALAEEIRRALHEAFRLAIRVRRVRGGLRVYQTSKTDRRYLMDVRPARDLPPSRVVGDVAFVTPGVLVAMKTISATERADLPARHQDVVDVERLLARYPELRTSDEVDEMLGAFGAAAAALSLWMSLRSAPPPVRGRGRRDEPTRPTYRSPKKKRS